MYKKSIPFLLGLILLVGVARAQTFNFDLIGNPVDTTGWNMANDSYIDNDEIVLTDPLNDQYGYIYFRTPQNLANCSQFTVTFDFKISNSSSSTADGIAFWYISNPPTGFGTGETLGLPSYPDGLALLMDTYNNYFPNDVPLISLRRYDGTTQEYVEGSTTGQITSDEINQSFITDGAWHTCKLVYSFGNVSVSYDNNPPIMTGTTTLNIIGYFGFSASTGGSYSKQAIKNVHISGAPEPDPPTTDTVFYCQYETADSLTALPDSNLLWYTTPVGGLPLAGAPVPSTAVPGTYTWYVSQIIPGCNIESQRSPAVVVVHPLPAPPVVSVPEYCSGQVGLAITNPVGQNVKWYSQPTGGVGSSNPPNINTAVADTQHWYVSLIDTFGCESPRDTVDVTIHQTPLVDFTYDVHMTCAGDTVLFNNQTQYGESYLWRLGVSSLTDTNENTKFYYADAGSYNVSLIASNQYCTDSTLKIVSLGHPLSANFGVSDDTVCQGTKIIFTDSSVVTTVNGIAPGYLWNFGNGLTSSMPSPGFTYDTPGVYPVSLVVSNGIPCYDTMTHLVIVDSLARLSVTVSDTPICQGDEVVFTGHYTQNGLVETAWNFGDAQLDSAWNTNPVSHAYAQGGQYPVYVKAYYRACPDTALGFLVTVHQLPLIRIGDDTTMCLDGDPVVIGDSVNYTNPAATWLWNTGDTTAFLKVVHPGHYWARVSINSCSTTDEINIGKDCYLDIPNSFTPNGDGVNDYFLPRQLLSKGALGFTMQIWDRWGEKVFETDKANGRGWDGRFNGKDQPVGVYVYMINVIYKNGRTEKYQGNLTLLR
ncbi:MAG TPA: PKD domain-containing protein [Edaphocola sp.]|nr:PKD domain-containing protein [Edaphocola sp.]